MIRFDDDDDVGDLFLILDTIGTVLISGTLERHITLFGTLEARHFINGTQLMISHTVAYGLV